MTLSAPPGFESSPYHRTIIKRFTAAILAARSVPQDFVDWGKRPNDEPVTLFDILILSVLAVLGISAGSYGIILFHRVCQAVNSSALSSRFFGSSLSWLVLWVAEVCFVVLRPADYFSYAHCCIATVCLVYSWDVNWQSKRVEKKKRKH